jgi:response regulator RpfG family c-di-GMP phosphodiesterase
MDISQMKVLSIDDNTNNLMMVEFFAKSLDLLVDSYSNPVEAIMAAEIKAYDIVLVDYMMPSMNGIEFIKAFRQIDTVSPIIMITALGDDIDVQLRALEVGATDFMSKPINSAVFKGRVSNLLKLKKAHLLVEQKAEGLQEEVGKATKEIREREFETLKVLGKTAEYKDPETGMHIQRVAEYSRILAKGYGLSQQMQDLLYYACPFHDIGKVGIPDEILLKADSLNEEEWQLMKRHPLIGFEILKNTDSEFLRAGGIIAFSHHERFDGTGYPKGLSGMAIPTLGRIVAVADVFDALTTKRPYKEAWSFDDGVAYIIAEKGKHFEPALVDVFITNINEIKHAFETYQEKES